MSVLRKLVGQTAIYGLSSILVLVGSCSSRGSSGLSGHWVDVADPKNERTLFITIDRDGAYSLGWTIPPDSMVDCAGALLIGQIDTTGGDSIRFPTDSGIPVYCWRYSRSGDTLRLMNDRGERILTRSTRHEL